MEIDFEKHYAELNGKGKKISVQFDGLIYWIVVHSESCVTQSMIRRDEFPLEELADSSIRQCTLIINNSLETIKKITVETIE